MDNKTNTLMQRYEIGRLLGQGTFAKVYYARNIKNGHSAAVKVINKEKLLKVGLMDQIKREISVLRLVKHPNIVQLYEVMATKVKIYFVLEYVKGGELFDKVAKGRLKEETARKYFQQLINAVDYCHSRGVYHRDLKPENLLLDENANLKVSDFGLSALAESKRLDGLLHTTCGTPAYVAPEVISRKGYEGAQADIWSCGVILFVLLAGRLPFGNSNVMEMYRKISKAEFTCPNWFPPDVRKLVVAILDPNPATRITIPEITENPWFKKGFKDKARKTKKDKREAIPVDEKREQEFVIPANCNAFDIISLSQGFDISGLFVDIYPKKEARFTSRQHAPAIISKLEEIAQKLRFKVKKKEGGVLKIEAVKEGRKGPLSIEAQIFEAAPSFHIVEMKKSNGDTMEYEKLWNHDIRPALKDIVWAWQGEKQKVEQKEEISYS